MLKMRKTTTRVGVLAGMAVGATVALTGSAWAQDACTVTTVEENIATVEAAIAAVEALNGPALDALLHDEHVDNIETFGVVTDLETNIDEIADMTVTEGIFPNSTVVVTDIFGVDDRVIVVGKFTLVAHNLTGETIELDAPLAVDLVSIYMVNCGQIYTHYNVTDGATLLGALGMLGDFTDTRIAE